MDVAGHKIYTAVALSRVTGRPTPAPLSASVACAFIPNLPCIGLTSNDNSGLYRQAPTQLMFSSQLTTLIKLSVLPDKTIGAGWYAGFFLPTENLSLRIGLRQQLKFGHSKPTSLVDLVILTFCA